MNSEQVLKEEKKLAAAYHACRNREQQMLCALETCDFENDGLLKELVPVQQQRARLARKLQID